VTHPFDIEEIFPGEASASVRLPRRQAGSSPQGLTVTLMADYTVRTRAWLPSAAILALLAEAGVSAAGARAAISRLARRGVLEYRRRGRHSLYRLTRAAVVDLSGGGTWIASYGSGAETWDGWWTLISFSLPEQQAKHRRALRSSLRWLGCAPLYDGLWISPLDLSGKADEASVYAEPRRIHRFPRSAGRHGGSKRSQSHRCLGRSGHRRAVRGLPPPLERDIAARARRAAGRR
jgi:phenylacetic acid degradation operon negative regulatory protein